MTPEKEKAYRSLKKALQTGYAIPKDSRTALDAVEAAVKVLKN